MQQLKDEPLYRVRGDDSGSGVPTVNQSSRRQHGNSGSLAPIALNSSLPTIAEPVENEENDMTGGIAHRPQANSNFSSRIDHHDGPSSYVKVQGQDTKPTLAASNDVGKLLGADDFLEKMFSQEK